MDFELTISGLCAVIFKSKDDQPQHPTAVEVLCVDAPGHQPRLSYWPEQVVTEAEPDLLIDPQGRKVASLDVRNQVINLTFSKDYKATFSVAWGPLATQLPPDAGAEAWMNWVPAVGDLGIDALRVGGAPGNLPQGASARLILPPGEILARNVVRDPNGAYLLWKFKDFKRALADNVVYRARNVGQVSFAWNQGSIFAERGGTLSAALSTDMQMVPKDFLIGLNELDHLQFVAELSPSPAVVHFPVLDLGERTGHTICDQVLFVDKS
jgi:hypothetical protein